VARKSDEISASRNLAHSDSRGGFVANRVFLPIARNSNLFSNSVGRIGTFVHNRGLNALAVPSAHSLFENSVAAQEAEGSGQEPVASGQDHSPTHHSLPAVRTDALVRLLLSGIQQVLLVLLALHPP